MIMKSNFFLIYLFILVTYSGIAQTYKVHSHNDYEQNVPFWKAYSAGVSSIEADVFLIEGELIVAHQFKEINSASTLKRLYLEPLRETLELGLFSHNSLQLLIDIKSEALTTMDALIALFKEYPMIIENPKISIVISGNRPPSSKYVNYPDFIFFDYQSLDKIDDPYILSKIGLISLSFRNFTSWNGKGRLTQEDLERITEVVKKAHSFKKPFRFWATPDSKTSWKTMRELGVDYINTDHPFECIQYINSLPDRIYTNKEDSEVYKPTFEKDGVDKTPKNVILMIGDGNGLAQISAAALANGGSLSLTQLKNIGFLKTQSGDDFTTDSAGAATAMATGEKVRNRAIGVDIKGEAIPNLMEELHSKGFSTTIITTDEITGATPASFYAHQKDRSMTTPILKDLGKSNLDIFIASRSGEKYNEEELLGFNMMESLEDLQKNKNKKIGFHFINDTIPAPLNTAVKTVLKNLNRSNKPFFLMVEGAKIDSYGHANKIDGVIKEGIAFDKAVAESLKFADTNKNTLVIITADHETGGLTLPQGNVENRTIEGDFTTDDHTGVFVPIFSYGPKSNLFQGFYDNTQVYHKIRMAIEF